MFVPRFNNSFEVVVYTKERGRPCAFSLLNQREFLGKRFSPDRGAFPWNTYVYMYKHTHVYHIHIILVTATVARLLSKDTRALFNTARYWFSINHFTLVQNEPEERFHRALERFTPLWNTYKNPNNVFLIDLYISFILRQCAGSFSSYTENVRFATLPI